MNSKLFFLLHFLAISIMACNEDDSINPNTPNNERIELTCSEAPGVCALSEPNNSFGFQLLSKLNQGQEDENIFISPLSISTALTMTTNGAASNTRSEMMQTLEIDDQPLDTTNSQYKNLLETLPDIDPKVDLSIANSIWYRLGYNVKPEFLETNTDFFKSEVNEIDFNLPNAVDIINGWIENNTNGLIKEMLDYIPGSAVMYLINAIYFKGDWLFQFDEKNTVKADFYLSNNSTIEVDMMHHSEVGVPYYQGSFFQAVDLPYGDSLFSMTILLPDENYTTDDLLEELEKGRFEEWVEKLASENVELKLPRFSMSYKQLLNDPLSEMGMPEAFTEGADFSNIADASLRISRVIHQSFVEVNEEGTEAAAATIVEILETSAPLIPLIECNKPFVFVIRERVGNNALFVGKLMNPDSL